MENNTKNRLKIFIPILSIMAILTYLTKGSAQVFFSGIGITLSIVWILLVVEEWRDSND